MADLSVCMIVKDEEDCIGPALDSVVTLASEVIVVDTGSTDNTREIARSRGAKIFCYDWKNNFSEARNYSLDKASGKWIFVIDADERLRSQSHDAVLKACKSQQEAFTVKIVNYLGEGQDREVSASVRLFRNRPEYRYSGRLHEQIGNAIEDCHPNSIGDSSVVIDHLGYLNSFEEKKDKRKRNLWYAKACVEQRPNDPFVHFNLAMEYYRIADYSMSLEEFAKADGFLTELSVWVPKMMKTWALCHLWLGETVEAVGICQRGIEVFPGYTDLYYVLGLANHDLGKYDEAKAMFLHCLELGNAPVPPWPAADMEIGGSKSLFALGRVFLSERKYLLAAREFKRSYEHNPQWTLPLVLMGASYRANGMEDIFLDYLDTLALDPVQKSDVLCRAWLYEPALRVLEKAGSGKHADILKTWAFLGTGQFEKADVILKRLEESEPHDKELALARRLWEAGSGVVSTTGGYGTEDRTVTQFFFIRSILALEDAVKRYPEQHLIREELDRLRREAAKLGLRGI